MRKLIAVILLAVFGCKTHEKVEHKLTGLPSGPPVLVYKTKANYNNLVPVILSDDKTTIVSYPDPTDIKTASGFAVPVLLHEGYLLDNRGIGKNVAFLNITYQDYAAFENVPNLKMLYNLIRDKDPLTELWYCGPKNSFGNVTKNLNNMIDNDLLKEKCKSLK